MQTVTREDIGKVARALITLNGKTTTLDVKNHLRNLGYWVKQGEVRSLMLDITSKDGDIRYEDNGVQGYREYSFSNPTTGVAQNLAGHVMKYDKGFGICTQCGCSEHAIQSFNWDVCNPATVPVPKTVSNDADTVISLNATRLATAVQNVPVPIHRDHVPAKYLVTDEHGNYRAQYGNVTRSQAKQQWATDMNMSFFMARTKKVV